MNNINIIENLLLNFDREKSGEALEKFETLKMISHDLEENNCTDLKLKEEIILKIERIKEEFGLAILIEKRLREVESQASTLIISDLKKNIRR